MGHTVKRGDEKTLRWDLARDLADVTIARVIISRRPALTPVLNRNGEIEDAATGTPTRRIVALTLTEDDYGVGKLEPGRTYLVEVETTSSDGTVLTHPDDRYEHLTVVTDLA